MFTDSCCQLVNNTKTYVPILPDFYYYCIYVPENQAAITFPQFYQQETRNTDNQKYFTGYHQRQCYIIVLKLHFVLALRTLTIQISMFKVQPLKNKKLFPHVFVTADHL